jgi:hypothetical protein
MLRVPENLQRAILDVLDERQATARELEKIIFGRLTDVGEVLVRRALRTLQSAGEVVPDEDSWLRWSKEKEKARQREVREERARQKKARQQEKAEHESARRAADEWEKTEQERGRRESRETNWKAVLDAIDAPSDPSRRDREILAKILGMLGSDHEGEKLNAAEGAEKYRRKIGMTWAELLGLA